MKNKTKQLIDRINSLEKRINAPIEGVIENHSYLNRKIIQRLVKVHSMHIRLFFKNEKDAKYQYTVDSHCPECLIQRTYQLPKNKTLEFIASCKKRKEGDFFLEIECSACKELRISRYEKTIKEKDEIRFCKLLETIRTDTEFKPEIKQSDRWQHIQSICFLDSKFVHIFAEKIKEMPYRDFLSTPYWKAISYQVKRRHKFKCMMCGSKKELQTHHNTYEHHGYEHEYLYSDLICICRKCHERHHHKD